MAMVVITGLMPSIADQRAVDQADDDADQQCTASDAEEEQRRRSCP